MSLGRAMCWEHSTARVCWLLNGTCPSCAVSGTPAVFAGAAPSGSWLFPKLNLVAKERACWEASFYFYRTKKPHKYKSSNPLEPADLNKV